MRPCKAYIFYCGVQGLPLGAGDNFFEFEKSESRPGARGILICQGLNWLFSLLWEQDPTQDLSRM